VQPLHVGGADVLEALLTERREDVEPQRAPVLGPRAWLQVHVDMFMFEALRELAERGRLRADRRRGSGRLLGRPGGRHGLVHARIGVAASEDGHGLPARFVDAVARAHEPEAVPVVLAVGAPEPGEEHLLAGGEHPQDEPG